MKYYTFTLTVQEGSDEFWESLVGKSGCDEVRAELKELIEAGGYYVCDGEHQNCKLVLTSFEDK